MDQQNADIVNLLREQNSILTEHTGHLKTIAARLEDIRMRLTEIKNLQRPEKSPKS